jgi:hypothetical protein
MKMPRYIAFVAACACALGFVPGATQEACANETSTTVTTIHHWKTSDEITFSGAIHELMTKPVTGAPAGLNLLMDGSQGVLYANVGSHLDNETKKALVPGQMITIKGVVRSFNGTNYLLARELTLGQQTLKVRGIHGMPAKITATASTQGNRPRGKKASVGGAQ